MSKLIFAAATLAMVIASPALALPLGTGAGGLVASRPAENGSSPIETVAARPAHRRTARPAAPAGAYARTPVPASSGGRTGNEYPYPYRNDDFSAIKPDRW